GHRDPHRAQSADGARPRPRRGGGEPHGHGPRPACRATLPDRIRPPLPPSGLGGAAPRGGAGGALRGHADRRMDHGADARGHARGAPVIYLDTSAAYKLLSREPEVSAVEALFTGGVGLLSSRLLEVELHATVDRRGGSHAEVEQIVRRVDLDA